MRIILPGILLVLGVTVVESLPTDPLTNLFLNDDDDMTLAPNTILASSLNDPLVSDDLVSSTDDLFNQVPDESLLSSTMFGADGSDGGNVISDTLDTSFCSQQLFNRQVSDSLILSEKPSTCVNPSFDGLQNLNFDNYKDYLDNLNRKTDEENSKADDAILPPIPSQWVCPDGKDLMCCTSSINPDGKAIICIRFSFWPCIPKAYRHCCDTLEDGIARGCVKAARYFW